MRKSIKQTQNIFRHQLEYISTIGTMSIGCNFTLCRRIKSVIKNKKRVFIYLYIYIYLYLHILNYIFKKMNILKVNFKVYTIGGRSVQEKLFSL